MRNRSRFTATMAVLATTLALGACAPEHVPLFYDLDDSPAVRVTPIRGGLIASEFDPGKGPVTDSPRRTLLGAAIPGQPGKSLTRADRIFAEEAGFRAHAAALGQTVQWANPQTGNSGTITPIRQGLSTIGSVCRQYHQIVNISGQVEEAYGTACRQPDGDWVVVN
jgi:surface antigen